jgi:hypothetical protein
VQKLVKTRVKEKIFVKKDHKNIEYALQNSKKLNRIEKLEEKIKTQPYRWDLGAPRPVIHQLRVQMLRWLAPHPLRCNYAFNSSALLPLFASTPWLIHSILHGGPPPTLAWFAL